MGLRNDKTLVVSRNWKQVRSVPRIQNSKGKMKLHPHLDNIARYVSHMHTAPHTLRMASMQAMPMHRLQTYTRLAFSTGTNNWGWVLLNPYYLFQTAIQFANIANDYFLPIYYTNSSYTGTTTNAMKDNDTGVIGASMSSGPYTTAYTSGNLIGKHRCVGLSFVLRYEGTELNRGGVAYVVQNAEMLSLFCNTAGFTLGTIIGWRDTHKHLIGPEAIVHNHTGRNATELDFYPCHAWVSNTDQPATGTTGTAGDSDVFGGQLAQSTAGVLWNMCAPDTAIKGWTVAILVNSAVATQNFELEIQGVYEGEFKTTAGTSAYSHESLPFTNPTHFAATTAMVAAKNQAAVSSGSRPDDLLTIVKGAAASVLPGLLDKGITFLGDALGDLFL